EMHWVACARGEVVCKEGDASDSLFVLVSGRAVAVHVESSGSVRVVSHIDQGETIGEMGLITGEPRSSTVVCWRDSELLRLDRDSFEKLTVRHPRILLSISQTISERLRRQTRADVRAHRSTAATIAVLSAGGDDGTLLHQLAGSLAA